LGAGESLVGSVHDVLVVGSIFLIALAILLWRVFYVQGKSGDEGVLTDGAVLLLADGMVQQASSAAVSLLGDCTNQPVVRVLEQFLGPDATDARDAVNRLEMTGERVDMLVYTPDGKPYELIGKPSGALIRLVFRDARLLDDKLRDAQQRVEAADTALNTHEWAQETLRGLIEEAPIIAWHRAAEGEINWSGGEIKARAGSVAAAQAVDLIVARTKLNNQPVLAGQPQKSRIEIVVNEGMETVSLHVIEIVRPDGSRIGFATDAGTATSAERTLTRFVQTMTETFAHLTVGLAIFDRNQTLALFNPALVTMWQVEPAWLARRPSLRDIIDELRATRRLPELQDFHKWRTRLIDLFENTEAADYEELWHLADGSNIRVLARPHPHGSLAFIFDDVTERMRLEQRYRHSIDLRRSTLDRLNEGVAVFGANGLLQFVNQAFHEIWGTDTESVFPAMHARQLVSMCETMTKETDVWHRLHGYITGEENRRAWTAQLTMESRRILTARFAPLPDGSTMAVFADITRSEHVSKQLAARSAALALAETMRASLARRLADQVAAPLGDIAEHARALSAEADGDAAGLAALAARAEQARVHVKNAAEMLGSAPLSPEGSVGPCDLAAIGAFTVWLLQDEATAAGVALAAAPPAPVDEAGESPLVACDAQGVRLAAYAVTTDALSVAAPGSRVVIGIDGDAGGVTVSATLVPAGPALAGSRTIAPAAQGEGIPDLSHLQRMNGAHPMPVRVDRAGEDGVRIACTLDTDRRLPALSPATGDLATDEVLDTAPDAAGYVGNVHPLKPRSIT